MWLVNTCVVDPDPAGSATFWAGSIQNNISVSKLNPTFLALKVQFSYLKSGRIRRCYKPYKSPENGGAPLLVIFLTWRTLRVGSGAKSGMAWKVQVWILKINLPGSTTQVKTCYYFSRSVLRKRWGTRWPSCALSSPQSSRPNSP